MTSLAGGVLLLVLPTFVLGDPLEIHWLDPELSEARCMDGSAFGYYFRSASSESTMRKWVIELQGGGWCYDEGDCYGRTLSSYANGNLGSSLNWTSTMGSYFLENQDWNRVFLRYCSGASFTGYRKEGWDASGWRVPGHPLSFTVPDGTKLWFRGAANLADTIAALQRDHGMSDVDELIVTGSSAGGLATILNVDRVQKLVGAKRVTGLADAGFFKYQANHTPPHYSGSANYSENMRRLFDMVNASGVLSSACQMAQTASGTAVPAPGGKELPPAGTWNCMMAATAVEYVESPLFILQSPFDHFQLGAIEALDCMKNMPYNPPWGNATCASDDIDTIAAYGADLSAELARVLDAPSEQRAVFLSACIVHGQQNKQAWTGTVVAGTTPQEAWRSWYNRSDTSNAKWVEESLLPSNPNSLSCAPFAGTFLGDIAI